MKIDIGDGCFIRPIRRSDIEALVRYANNPNVARNLEDRFPNPYTRKDAEEWLERIEKQETVSNFAITTSREMIGGIGLHPRPDVYQRTAELGYWLGEPFWGEGIATRAVRAIVAWGFTNFDLSRIQARVFESNPASGRVLEKVGFTCEGRLRQSVTKHGVTMDQLIFAMLSRDFEELERST